MSLAFTTLGDGPTGPDPTQAAVGSFLAAHPDPTSGDIAGFLQLIPVEARTGATQALIAGGADPNSVGAAMRFVDAGTFNMRTVVGVLALASMAASTYHGYKRNNSVGWALVWGFFGTVAPVITPVVAVAQGYGKRKAS